MGLWGLCSRLSRLGLWAGQGGKLGRGSWGLVVVGEAVRMCLFICGWCELRGRGGAGSCLSLPGELLRIGVPCPSRAERGALGAGCGWVVGLVVTAGVLEVYHSLTGRVAIWILWSIRVLLRLGDRGGGGTYHPRGLSLVVLVAHRDWGLVWDF